MLRSKQVWALVALNALLMAVLVGRWLTPSTAMAQPAAAAARPGDYLMVPAEAEGAVRARDSPAVTGRTTKGGDALFLTDHRTGMMAVFVYDPASRSLRALDVRSVTEAFAGGRAGRAADREDRGGRAGDRAV